MTFESWTHEFNSSPLVMTFKIWLIFSHNTFFIPLLHLNVKYKTLICIIIKVLKSGLQGRQPHFLVVWSTMKSTKPAQHKPCGLFYIYCRLVRIAESLTGIDVKWRNGWQGKTPKVSPITPERIGIRESKKIEHSLRVLPGWGKARSQTVEHKDKQLPVRRQDVGLRYP